MKTVVSAALVILLLSSPQISDAKARTAKSSKRAVSAPAKVRSEAAVPKAQRKPVTPPQDFVAQRAQRVLLELKRRPIGIAGEAVKIDTSATKTDWLSAIYSKRLIEASWATQMLADKRILFAVLERELGAGRAREFYPKTVGLREFLWQKGLVNPSGQITATGERIEEALFEEFSAGFVVRPAVGVAPGETGRGLFKDTDEFIVELVKDANKLYSPAHLKHPVKSHLLEAVASGEAVVLQENIVNAADVKAPLKSRFFQEVRIHTFENRVVAGAVPSRWVQTNLLTPEQITKAEDFVLAFLANLPLGVLSRQAFGIDVAVMDNGEMRIVDIVTNRGQQAAWSSYLDQPRVIAAYSKHFELYQGLRFSGVSGSLIRHGFANYLPFWSKRIEKAKPGLDKVLAYLPPMP